MPYDRARTSIAASRRAISVSTKMGTKEFEEVIDPARAERTATAWNIVVANLLVLIDLTVVVGSLDIVRTYALLRRCDCSPTQQAHR